MSKIPLLPEGVVNNIVEYVENDIEINPLTGDESSLFKECLRLTDGDYAQAAQIAAYAYDPLWVNEDEYDWYYNKDTTVVKDKEGMPKLFYRINGRAYSNIIPAINRSILENLASRKLLGFQEKDFLTNYTQFLTNFTENPDFYKDGRDYKSFFPYPYYFNNLCELKRLGVLDSMPKIEVGFVSTNNPTKVITEGTIQPITGDYEFKHIQTITPSNIYSKILNLFDSSYKGRVQLYQHTPDRLTATLRFNYIWGIGTGLTIKPTATIRSLALIKKSNRFIEARDIYDILHENYPQFYNIYDNNVIRARGFIAGAGLSILKNTAKRNSDVNNVVKEAIEFEQLLNCQNFNFKEGQKYNILLDTKEDVTGILQQTPEVAASWDRISSMTTSSEILEELSKEPSFGVLVNYLKTKLPEIKVKFVEGGIPTSNPITGDMFDISDGSYNTKTNTITLSKSSIKYAPQVVLHEMLHVLTVKSLRANTATRKEAIDIFNDAQKLIFEKYNVKSINELGKQLPKLAYNLSSADEFYSALWTDPSFIKELNSVGPKAKKSLISRVLSFLKQLLGIEPTSKIYEDASQVLLRLIENQPSLEQMEKIKALLPEELYSFSNRQLDLFEDQNDVFSSEQSLTEKSEKGDDKTPLDITPVPPSIILNAQQQKAVNDISALINDSLEQGNRKIIRIVGKAGTGKTTVCPEILKKVIDKQHSLGNEDPRIMVAAVSNNAKDNLFSKFPKWESINSASIAALTGRTLSYDEQGNEIWVEGDAKKVAALKRAARKIKILIVDESSMLSNEIMSILEKDFCINATIIYVGDKRQVRPVEKEYNAVTPFSERPVDYSIELLERVRQGEGAPVLDVADVYGDISANPPEGADGEKKAAKLLGVITAQMNKNITEITPTSALISVPKIEINKTIDSLMPIIFQAMEERNPQKIGIVPYYNTGGAKTRAVFNRLIRQRIIEEKLKINVTDPSKSDYVDVDNIPPIQGEILNVDAPISIDDDNETIDTATKLIASGYNERKEIHTVDNYGNDITIGYYMCQVFFNDAYGTEKEALINILDHKYEPIYKQVLKQKKANAFLSGARGMQKTLLVDEYKKIKDLNSSVSPAWALNVHKAQGQTYEIAYIPIYDYGQAMVDSMRRYEREGKNENTYKNLVTQIASQLYTAITRSSNITILEINSTENSDTSLETLEGGLKRLNDKINSNKKSSAQLAKEVIELKPVTPIKVGTQKNTIEEIVPEQQPVIQESTQTAPISTTSENGPIVPPKLRKLYDFLKFATGDDLLFKSLNTAQGKDQAQRLSQMFFQREAELLKFGRTFGKAAFVNGHYDFNALFKGNNSLLFYPITEEKLQEIEQSLGEFKRIDSLDIKDAQAVIPSQYAETFKLGKHNLADITVDYFKHAPNYYWSQVNKTDLLIRLHNGQLNVATKGAQIYGKPINITQDSLGYRLNSKGERMYFVPKGAQVYNIIGKDGQAHDTIVLNGDKNVEKIRLILKSVQDNIVSVQPFLTNITDLKEAQDIVKLAEQYTIFSLVEPNEIEPLTLFRIKKGIGDNLPALQKALLDYYNDQKNAKRYTDKLSNTLYNSFVKACSITSSRIPTQALASFMNMQVVAFNPQGSNDIFVSRWQMWLQGSDLDIDKAYMMGHSFAPSGMFKHWSPLADYSSEQKRKISDELPVPNGIKLLIRGEEEYNAEDTGKTQIVHFDNQDPILDKLLKTYFVSLRKSDAYFEALKNILVYFNRKRSFHVNEQYKNNLDFRHLIAKLNKHNMHKVTEEEAKNVAVDSIIKVCKDPRNIQSAHSPIDAATSRLKKFLSDIQSGRIGDENDGLSIFQLQEDNQTGKKVVGVMANALKAFLTLTQYYNNYYHDAQNISEYDRQYFLNKITIGGKVYNMSTVANTRLEEQQLKVLKNALLKYAKVPDSVLQSKDDVSIILSAMVTLATDNAKELALAKLHASLNLASMHTYLLTMGVPFDDVVNYTVKSQLFSDLYELTKANTWTDSTGTVSPSVFKALIERAKTFSKEAIEQGKGYTIMDVKQLQNLHTWAKEFRTLTAFLGINQGMSNGIAQVISFKNQFENVIINQVNSIDNGTFVPFTVTSLLKQTVPSRYGIQKNNNTEYIEKIIRHHGLNPKDEELQNYYIAKLIHFEEKYGDAPLLFSVDMNQYYTDNNYREKVKDLYDIFKSTINIFDVLDSIPSFNEMLKAFNTTVRKISRGAKGDLLNNKLNKLYDPRITDVEVPFSVNDEVVKGAQDYCDDYFICDFLVNVVQPEYAFTYDINPSEETLITKEVNFDINEGLKSFEQVFKTLIIKLKNANPSEFTKSIIQYRTRDGRMLFKLNFNLDMLNKNQAGEQQLKYNQIAGEFNKIRNLKLSDFLLNYKNNKGNTLTVGDMFYLYNLIFNLGKRGQNSFTALLDGYTIDSSENSLVTKYLQNVLSFDLMQKKIAATSESLMLHIAKRKAGEQPFKIADRQILAKDQILTNFSTVTKKKTLTNTYQKLLSAIRSGKLQIEMDLNCY